MIISIDGRHLPAQPEDTLLDVARRNNIHIPTLCHHEGVEAWGGCRLCVVEVRRPGARTARVVPACIFPAGQGIAVETATPRILRIRATVLDLLLARAPEAERVRRLALDHGIQRTSFVPRDDPDKCILCNICVRACAAVGANAIGTAGRGADGRISLPFSEDASDCIGCGACALSCPTGAIEMVDRGPLRTIWGREFERLRCEGCGQPTLTREHAAHLHGRGGLPEESFRVCDTCHRQRTGHQILALVAKQGG